MSSLNWKFNRLRTMGLPEIGHRVRQAVQLKLESFMLARSKQQTSPRLSRFGKPWITPLPCQFGAGLYCDAADRILAGYYDVFALKGVHLGFPPRWNRDPKTGIEVATGFW